MDRVAPSETPGHPLVPGEMRWCVPTPLAVGEAVMDDGAVIVLRRHGNPDGVRLVLSHANGFAIDAYYPFWSLLTERFDVVLYDLRNHGWNAVGPLDGHGIGRFVDDTAHVADAIARHFGAKPMIGVFHSVSGLTAAAEASARRGSFAALLLFDPFVCPSGSDPEHRQRLERTMSGMAHAARRRRESFDTPEAYAGRLATTPAFERLRPGVAELLARTTLRPAADGGYVLRCPRGHEARVYEQGFDWAQSVELGTLSGPIKVIGSDPLVPHSFLPTVAMHEILALNYDFVPETTHFLQLEEPERCAAATVDFVETVTDVVPPPATAGQP